MHSAPLNSPTSVHTHVPEVLCWGFAGPLTVMKGPQTLWICTVHTGAVSILVDVVTIVYPEGGLQPSRCGPTARLSPASSANILFGGLIVPGHTAWHLVLPVLAWSSRLPLILA